MPTENPLSFQGLNTVPGGAGLRGARCTQCSGSHVNSQLPTHGQKNVAGWAVAWATPARNPVITHLVGACQLWRQGSTSARGLLTRPTLGSVAGPHQLSRHPPPPTLSLCFSLHQPLTLLKLTSHIIAASDYYNFLYSRHCVQCFPAFLIYASK